ncbi:hypothetical protein B0T17DRAFT_496620 [Bombardia bombarda]|uniref:Uncharacterized protein n=1 Tax=Bombardia bombarda TaxID=252184 RepID=A0AA39WIB9_9PEZI|nr:hypothetical protein B0T17DRAFT_496620 [Bombardia bombarda]
MLNGLAVLNLLYSTSTPLSPPPRNITITLPDTPLAPSPLTPPGSSSHGEEIIRQFLDLGRLTQWKLVEKVKFEGDTFEPEGLVRLGDDHYFVSAGEYIAPTIRYNSTINGTDRTTGEGFGHMIVFNGKGNRIADATITEAGSVEQYHNGGLDYDGTYIWATLAQYRPNSTATLVRMRPSTLDPEPMLHIADHMGGAVHDLATGNILTLNWGSRNASVWHPARSKPKSAFAVPRAVLKNPSHYTDYQDCKYLGRFAFAMGGGLLSGRRSIMLCSGITGIYGVTIGGVALVDMETMLPLYEVPLTMVSDLGTLVTKNPMDVAVVRGKMRLYFLPDERNSTLYVYEVA